MSGGGQLDQNQVSLGRHAVLMRMATYASVSVAIVLIAIKSYAWLETSSVSLLSSLVDSGLDVVASLINLIAVHHSLLPADRYHRFGHGKAEALAGLGQSLFVAGSALFIGIQAILRFMNPETLPNASLGIGVMVASMVLTLALVQFQRYVARTTGSLAISADSMHYISDLAQNAGVILAIVLAGLYGFDLADPIIAAILSLVILYAAWSIVSAAYDVLMDRELPDEDRIRIRDVVLSHAEVKNMHDLRTRRSGTLKFIQLHLELDASITLIAAHEIADEVEEMLMIAFPGSEIIIHEDPEGVVERRVVFDR